ncbi:hypothetical protein ACFS07_31665 [Undibacterium arcticum]
MLTPDMPLSGLVAAPKAPADVGAVIREIELARQEEEDRIRYQMEMLA